MTPRTKYLTRADIEEILHYSHWIAAKNGAQAQFVREKYPRYSYPALIQALKDSGCLVKSRTPSGALGHFSGWQVRARIDGVEIPVFR